MFYSFQSHRSLLQIHDIQLNLEKYQLPEVASRDMSRVPEATSLPPGWVTHVSKTTGQQYYFNLTTGSSTYILEETFKLCSDWLI